MEGYREKPGSERDVLNQWEEGNFLSNNGVRVLGRAVRLTVALRVLINSGHLRKCSVIVYLLGGAPKLCCCCLARSEEPLGDCSTTANAAWGTEVASSTSVIHWLKKELFQIDFSDVSEESSAPVKVSGTQQIATSAPRTCVTLKLSRELCFFQTCGFRPDVCQQS